MELEVIPLEKKKNGDGEGASESVLEVKTEEEAQPDHYAKLQTPAEDVYAEAFFGDKKAKAGKQTEGNARLYRAGCLFLTLICLVLLLVVIILSVKLQTGSADCPGWQVGAGTGTTGTNFPKTQRQQTECHHCGNGWMPFEKSCYYLSTVRMSWSMSQRNCTAGGGSLVVISTRSVQNFLTGAAKGVYWIGLSLTGTQWKWVDNSALRDSYWEDKPSKGDCGLLRGEGLPQKNWFKWKCEHASYFICEKLV